MRFNKFMVVGLLFLGFFAMPFFVFAEDKSAPGGIIPKLPTTPNDPELFNDFVYPSWGPVCQRYTYTVTYKDKEGREPEYMRIIFNDQPVEMEKANPNDNDYKQGVRYVYKFVPNSLDSNFYYFEASNGLGKTRAAIIDSPDNGPVLFESAFDNNQIMVVDSKTGQKILNFETKEEWVGGIALSDDGKYLAAKTSNHVYLFDTQKSDKPLWEFQGGSEVGGDVKGGVAISGDGSRIFALIGSTAALFDKNSDEPIWKTEVGNGYNVAISKNGKYMAAGLAGGEEEKKENSNLLILWDGKSENPLWQYHSSGNFHDVSLSSDGSFIGVSTGCPDRKAYIFSKDSSTPILISDQLTRDSPVHRAKISADGSLMAVSSESDAGAVFLFKKDAKEPVWKFPTQNGSSVRALSFTPSGNYIGAATFGGQAYIFESGLSQPVASWTVGEALGGVDISDDGTFIATGGTDKKLHIFEKGKTTGMYIPFNEYVEEIDISANGRYIAAGTGGSVYFFESFNKSEGKIFPCTTIIEPKPQEMMGGQEEKMFNDQKQINTPGKLPGMLFGFGFLGSLLGLGGYLAAVKFNLLRINRKIIIILSVLSVIFLVLTIAAIFVNKNPPGKVIMNEDKEPVMDSEKQKSGCGNGICEPIVGETKESCPKDCSAGN